MKGPDALHRYLERRGPAGPWSLAGSPARGLAGAVVIPALAEADTLPATLAGLAANPPALRERFLVVVVVNNRPAAGREERLDNRRLLAWLEAGRAPAGLHLAWVDAASPGRELPPAEGVGLARKIGLDLALERLEWDAAEAPLLVCLDADTLVGPDYLPAIAAGMAGSHAAGGVLPFAHQSGGTPALDRAIIRYELALRGYVLGLTLAGSPYAFPAVGSIMVCRAPAYLAVGGMNRRQAGEDFYFLQQLAKHGRIAGLRGTLVRPAARLSRRVPFGTGQDLGRQLQFCAGAARCYPVAAFEVLRDWLQLAAAATPATGGEPLLAVAGRRDPGLGEFLAENRLAAVWDRLRGTHRSREALQRAFHGWFDALKSFRLIRRLTTAGAGPGPPETHLPLLLERCGYPPPGNSGKQLALLRDLQHGQPRSAA